MLHLNARAGYPNTKKGRKMKYEDNLLKKPKIKTLALKLTIVYATILTILKSH